MPRDSKAITNYPRVQGGRPPDTERSASVPTKRDDLQLFAPRSLPRPPRKRSPCNHHKAERTRQNQWRERCVNPASLGCWGTSPLEQRKRPARRSEKGGAGAAPVCRIDYWVIAIDCSTQPRSAKPTTLPVSRSHLPGFQGWTASES
jgi:hypothetical protein